MMQDARTGDVKVFVHLGHGFGVRNWKRRYSLGLIPGLNDSSPYGYHRAAGDGWTIEYSQDAVENSLISFFRRALHRVLGFDLIHAWRNRKEIFSADIVWTHTELEHLAVLLLLRARRQRRKPKVLANSVWLFDQWPELSSAKRRFYRMLLGKADAVTTFSPLNMEVAKKALPGVRCEFIRWGIAVSELKQPRKTPVHSPLRVASLGNDIHRDWKTLIEAFGNREGYEVGIGSNRINRKLLDGIGNVALLPVTTSEDVKALYEWADIAVVSLKPNLHASGITVILESVVRAVPSVCTDTGGLRAYFSPGEVCFVPPFAPVAMKVAVDELARDQVRRSAMVYKAQQRLFSSRLTTEGFANRHKQLSAELLGREAGCNIERRIA